MKEVGSGFVYPSHLLDLERINQYPELVHKYGMRLPSPEQPLHWMTYKVPDGRGEISFLRRLHVEYPEFAQYVCDYLSSLFHYYFNPERVNFMRTRGSIAPHVDEAGRKCTINIGVLNSNTATTYQSKFVDPTRWNSLPRETVTCQDGHAYLVNTSKLHSVEGTKDVDRYMIAYGFSVPYHEVLSALKTL